MLCTNCGQLSADSSRCEHCQAPLPDRQQTPPYQNGIQAGVPAMVFFCRSP